MSKLNQIIAIEKGIKARVVAETSELYKIVQKQDLFTGFSKVYTPLEEGGESLPPERKKGQFTSGEVLQRIERGLSELMEVTARKDWTNCEATASVVVGDVTIVEDAPVTYLLFLEKQVTDLRTFISNLPVLDEAEDWTKDANSGYFKSAEVKTRRTKKVQRPIVLYGATPEHPAQTQLITEDIGAGDWTSIKISGAIPKPEKQELQDRVEALLIAVKEAREAANMTTEIVSPDVGAAIFGYLFHAE